MKIYFAGSIRGGRNDKEIYLLLIEYIRNFGEVLTEHVGSPELTEEGEKDLSDGEIFQNDMNWLKECDALIAEVTTPSLGVGYEIGVAETLGKPILCLFRPEAGLRLSAMISGNNRLSVREYNTLNQAKDHIKNFFESASPSDG